MIQGGGELLMTQVNTTIACFVPACISLIIILMLGRLPAFRNEWNVKESQIMERKTVAQEDGEKPEGMTLVQAFIPYFLLSVIALVVLLVEPVHTFLGRIQIGFSFPETVTGYGYVNEAVESFSPLSPFTHASMFLLISSLAGMIYYRKKGWDQKRRNRKNFYQSRVHDHARPEWQSSGWLLCQRLWQVRGRQRFWLMVSQMCWEKSTSFFLRLSDFSAPL